MTMTGVVKGGLRATWGMEINPEDLQIAGILKANSKKNHPMQGGRPVKIVINGAVWTTPISRVICNPRETHL